MKRAMYALLLLLFVASGFVFANRAIKKETPEKPSPKPMAAADRAAAMKQWEATPEGMRFKQWEASPAGKKVYASEAKIRKALNNYSGMEAVVSSLSLPPGSRLGYGMMVKINGEDYILSFGVEEKQEFQQLRTLKVADRILLKSHHVSHAPKYAYPIVSGAYVSKDGKLLYKLVPRKGGC